MARLAQKPCPNQISSIVSRLLGPFRLGIQRVWFGTGRGSASFFVKCSGIATVQTSWNLYFTQRYHVIHTCQQGVSPATSYHSSETMKTEATLQDFSRRLAILERSRSPSLQVDRFHGPPSSLETAKLQYQIKSLETKMMQVQAAITRIEENEKTLFLSTSKLSSIVFCRPFNSALLLAYLVKRMAKRVTGIVGLREAAMSESPVAKFLWTLLFFTGLATTGFVIYKTTDEYLCEPTATKVSSIWGVRAQNWRDFEFDFSGKAKRFRRIWPAGCRALSSIMDGYWKSAINGPNRGRFQIFVGIRR